jgi:putative Mn2+ efflux pump MntP
MTFWETFVLALALGLDTFGIGLSAGAAQRQGGWKLYLRLALVLAAFQTLMPVVGWLVGAPLSALVQRWAHWISFALLAYAGGRMIWEGLEGEEESEFLDLQRWRALLFLGVATSLDELAVGVGLGLSGQPIALLAALDFAWTLLLALAGTLLGQRASQLLGKRAPVLGGAVLFYIAGRILIEGLSL